MGFLLISTAVIVAAILGLKLLGDRAPKSKWARSAIVLAVLGAFLFVSMPMHSYSYKVTIEADIDGKLRTGSGVFKTTWQYMPTWTLSQNDWSSWHAGEAPVIDLGNGAALLATLTPTSPYNQCLPQARFLANAPAYALRKTPGEHHRPAIYDRGMDNLFSAVRTFQGRYQLLPYEFPQFVLLPDRKDPATAEIVCPNDVITANGSPLRVKSVAVEMTSDRPDGKIYQVLPWLDAELDAEAKKRPGYGKKFVLKSYDLLGGW